MTLLAIMFAAVLSAQPLVNEDILEQSVLNEVDHALNAVTMTNDVPVSAASVDFAMLHATNGLNATQRAIGLVSSQKDGRWTWRGEDVTAVATRLLRRVAGYSGPPLKVSIFANCIGAIAAQEHIPFMEAARKVRALGYSGADVMEGLSDDRIDALKSAGLVIPCVIGFTQFEKSYDTNYCARLMALARRCECRRIMLVPGFYPAETNRTEVFRTIVERTNRFAAEAARNGFETIVEDFDDTRSPTYCLAGISAFLAAAPSVGFVYDTGNFNAAGEAPENGLKLLARVRHFHLKDRPAPMSKDTVAIGSGSVPMAKLINAARDVGYTGWFTVEVSSRKMLSAAESSIRFLDGIR